MTKALVQTRHKFLRRYPTNDIFFLWFKYKGHRYQYSLQTADESLAKVKAEDEIKRIKAQVDANNGVRPTATSQITLSTLLEDFLKAQARQVESKQLKPRSYESIEDGVKKIRRERPDWLAKPAAKLTFQDIDDYVLTIRKDQSPTTVNKVVDALKRAYDQAIEQRLLLHNPATKIRRASLHAVKADDIPTEEQYQQLLEHFRKSKLPHKWHLIDLIEFLSNFGLRINEAANLRKSDVDLPGRQLAVRGDPDPNIRTKNGTVRFLPIFDHTVPLIERLLARPHLRLYGREVRAEFLLSIGEGYISLRAAADKLGIPLHGHHTFRHLCATRWIEKGVNIKHVAKWLGHRDGGKLALTVYTKARDAQDKAEAAKVSGTIMDVPVKPVTNIVPLRSSCG